MTTFRKTILAAAAVSVSQFSTATAEELTGWNIHAPDYPGSIAMERFAELVDQRTGGRFQPSVYHSAQLGDQTAAIEQMALDGMQWAVFSSGSLGDVAEELKVVSLPYVFRSSTHMFSVVDGEIGGQLSDALAGANMVVLSWFDGGARSFYTVEKPIRTPADIVGLKIRVPNAEVFIATAEALGANATPLAFAEVYTALQTGVVDGAENNAPSLVSTRHHEVVNYYSLDEHLMVPEALVLSKTVWDGLSEEDRAVFMGAAREAADLQRSLWTDRTDASMAAAREQGVEIIEIADKEPFVDAMVPVYEKLVTSNSVRELLAAIQAVE